MPRLGEVFVPGAAKPQWTPDIDYNNPPYRHEIFVPGASRPRWTPGLPVNLQGNEEGAANNMAMAPAYNEHEITETASSPTVEEAAPQATEPPLLQIHEANYILRHARFDKIQRYQFANTDRSVDLAGRAFTADEVKGYEPWLRASVYNQWLRPDEDGTSCTDAEPHIGARRSTVYVNPALFNDRLHLGTFMKPEISGSEARVAWIILVRGIGRLAYKVRVFETKASVTMAMFKEAFCGYSVVFSAMVMKKDLVRMADGNCHFAVVANVRELLAYERPYGENDIPICC